MCHNRDQKTTFQDISSSLLSLWVLGIELWSSVLIASPFTRGVEPSLGPSLQSMFMGGCRCLAGMNEEVRAS